MLNSDWTVMSRAESRTTPPMEKAIKELRCALFIRIAKPICPKNVDMNPTIKHTSAYSMSRSPKTTKDVVAAKLVKRIMQADEADATAGCTSIASISGPFTMPPPAKQEPRTPGQRRQATDQTIMRHRPSCHVPTPNMPAKKPAAMQITGYLIVAVGFHWISPSRYL